MPSCGWDGRVGRPRNITQAIAKAVAPNGSNHHINAFTRPGYASPQNAKSPGLAAECAFPLRTSPFSWGLQRRRI